MGTIKKRNYSDVSVVGYSFDAGGKVAGSRNGPKAMRKRGLINQLLELEINVTDVGDVEIGNHKTYKSLSKERFAAGRFLRGDETLMRSVPEVFQNVQALYDLVSRALKARNGKTLPLILGGDHSLSIGSVAALSDFYKLKRKKVGLIWVDTHPDSNTPLTSPSKRIFGIPVAVLLGLVPGQLASVGRGAPYIQAKNLVYIGLRDVDPGERELLKRIDATAFSMKEVDMLGIAEVVRRANAIASKGTSGYAVSFDLDVCDPQLVPGTGTPHRGGLSFRESHLLMELLYDYKKLLMLEMVELNPRLDKKNQTADFAISLIESAFGKSIL